MSDPAAPADPSPATPTIPERKLIPAPTTLVQCVAFWVEPIPGDYLFHFDYVWITPELKAVIDNGTFTVSFVRRNQAETPALESP
jgi:hypothetical protein